MIAPVTTIYKVAKLSGTVLPGRHFDNFRIATEMSGEERRNKA